MLSVKTSIREVLETLENDDLAIAIRDEAQHEFMEAHDRFNSWISSHSEVDYTNFKYHNARATVYRDLLQKMSTTRYDELDSWRLTLVTGQ